ncbi:MAG: glutamate--tRNA ligase [Desulfobacteraceae bacterium]|nr:glutamate--tRNA ligase [Desulfobacteraceae bacterium]
METIVTRFAPSPTGYLHVGGARTALFNWLYSRHMNGKFVLRIEDTDRVRSTRESVDAIFDALKWLEIDWDEGPFFQSERQEIYLKYVNQLIDTGNAYYCTCTPEQIDLMRKKAMETGDKPKYDGTCREKGLGKSDNAVVRFKAPVSGTTLVEDVIKGNIVFQNSEQDDFVICRSNGTPTYNFVVVVDDMTMGINTIIRGDDHVMNTPKQILLYQALGSKLPVFGHVPMVLGGDRARLSKRHGATSVTAYRDMGFLPDAFINYLVRLGWSFGDQEFFTRDELIEKFTLENIGKSAGIFDQTKLTALNADHIKAAAPDTISCHLIPFLKKEGITTQPGDYLNGAIQTLVTRSKTLQEMSDGIGFYFSDDIEFDEKAAKKFLKPGALGPISMLEAKLSALSEPFEEKELEAVFKSVMDDTGLKLGKIAQPVRVALTGTSVSPGIFEIIQVMGKTKVTKRLAAAVDYINERASVE